MRLLPVILLASGCAAAGPGGSREPGVYTPTSQVVRPVGALSTSCTFDTNGLGAACRPLDRTPEGPIAPISAGQPR